MEHLSEVIGEFNSVLWDRLLVFFLCGTGVYFTLKLDYIQLRKFGDSIRIMLGSFKQKEGAAGAGGMSSFQSLATSVAAQIGVGNLAGVATAMVSGGPGAVFWMWLSALLGMAIIYAEATLAQRYKTMKNGEVVGGPAYYMQAAFPGPFGKLLAGAFALLLIVSLGFMGNMVQANSVGGAMESAFGIPPMLTGAVLGGLSLLVFGGGVRRIVSVSEKLVPAMALFFTAASLIVIFKNYRMILPSFGQIFIGAFVPEAVVGGVLGVSVREAIRFGVARGLFTHEAGMGSTPHAHAMAKVKHPCQQGLVAMLGVFIDTIVLLPLTVLVILTTSSLDGKRTGIELTQYAFSRVFGDWGGVLVAVCVLFFAFASIVGWYFFGLANVKYLFGKGAVGVYSVLVSLAVAVGCTLKVDLVWNLADLFNGFMVLPNLAALLALGGVVTRLTREYERRE